MKHQSTLLCLLLPLLLFSQRKREEIFDYSFKPVREGGYFYVVTEKSDSLFNRKAWYLSQGTKYLEGWYRDEQCKTPHGVFNWYHVNGYLHETGRYVNGHREGTWLRFDEEGLLKDSSTYLSGRKKGISLSWHKNDFPADSTNFDGAGNGVQVQWHDDGSVAAAGYWMQDTLKQGRWKYYERGGKLLATEEYNNQGKLVSCNCYDEQGIALDTALCKEKEATVNRQRWRIFLERNLQPLIEQKAREGVVGSFTVAVRFVVEKDGRVTDAKALTNYGHGIEEAVTKIFRNAPAWTPGRLHGRTVRSYHTQPVTFVIRTQ